MANPTIHVDVVSAEESIFSGEALVGRKMVVGTCAMKPARAVAMP